jgi:ribosome-binding factor A
VPIIEFKIDEDLEHQYKLLKIITEINDQKLDLKKDKNNE